MGVKALKITYKGVFIIALFVLVVSRVLVLTDNYNWPINPVLIEMFYLCLVAMLLILFDGGKLRIPVGKTLTIYIILLVHTILWGLVFVDRSFVEVITSHFSSQIMFVIIIIITVTAINNFDIRNSFLKCGYYALSITLFIQFVSNFSQLDLSNLANIMTVSDRTRANFGFGHYNTLGAACVCNILIFETLRKEKRVGVAKLLDVCIVLMSLAMLLCSASRSSITSLVLYYVLYYNNKIDEWPFNGIILAVLKMLRVIFVVALSIWVFLEVDYSNFLALAQRAVLFEQTLPMFFATGKIWLGLGYASNVAYASGLTPYVTHWLDNAYAYYMVTTGLLGVSLLMVAFAVLGFEIYKRVDHCQGKEVFAVFLVYAYVSLFEATMFNSGGLVNYIYLPWFLCHISRHRV